jgi:hypothetical protein
MKLFVETVGWLGAIIMLIAYVLLTVGRLKSAAPSYHWLNIISGAGLICNSGWNGAYPSVFINAVWLVIGLYGVFRAGASARSSPGMTNWTAPCYYSVKMGADHASPSHWASDWVPKP